MALSNEQRCLKIKIVKVDDTHYGIKIADEVFKVDTGCMLLGEAGSLIRAIKTKIQEAIKKQRKLEE